MLHFPNLPAPEALNMRMRYYTSTEKNRPKFGFTFIIEMKKPSNNLRFTVGPFILAMPGCACVCADAFFPRIFVFKLFYSLTVLIELPATAVITQTTEHIPNTPPATATQIHQRSCALHSHRAFDSY